MSAQRPARRRRYRGRQHDVLERRLEAIHTATCGHAKTGQSVAPATTGDAIAVPRRAESEPA